MKRFLPALLCAALLGGCATESGRTCLWPLCQYDSKHEQYWFLAGLAGSWRCSDYHVNHWLLPFYLKNSHGLFSPVCSEIDFDGLEEDFYLCGLAGKGRTADGYRHSWTFPLYWHDRDGLATPLYGNIGEAYWVTPFYYRDRTDFHTLFWSEREDMRTGERGVGVPLLLSTAFWNVNSCERAWYALGGLAGAKTNAADTHHEHWLFPLYSHESARYQTERSGSANAVNQRLDVEKTETSVLLFLYDRTSHFDRLSQRSSVVHRVFFLPVWRENP